MQPNPTPQPPATAPAAAVPPAPPAAPEPPPKPDAPPAPPATPEPPAPPVATFPTPSPSSPPYALKEIPQALQEKDLHDIEPRAVTVFGVQCWVIGHCIVARSEFSAISLNHEAGEVTLQTKNGLACTTGLAPNVFALFVAKQSPLAIVKPGE